MEEVGTYLDLFAKSAWEVSAEVLIAVEGLCTGDQVIFGFRAFRIWHATFDRADCLACFVFVKSDAFGAKLGVDDVCLIAFRDCLIWAFRLARAAVNALFRDLCCHGVRPETCARQRRPDATTVGDSSRLATDVKRLASKSDGGLRTFVTSDLDRAVVLA